MPWQDFQRLRQTGQYENNFYKKSDLIIETPSRK